MARSKGGGRRPALAHRLVERVEIAGFKSIVEQSIELGALNVLVGANGSGKTALLEAIGVLGAAAGGRVDDRELLRRGVRPSVARLFNTTLAELKRAPRSIALRAEDSSKHHYAVHLEVPEDSPARAWRFERETLGRGDEKILSRSPRRARWMSSPGEQGGASLEPCVGASRYVMAASDRAPTLRAFMEVLGGFAIFDPQTAVLRGNLSELYPRHPVGLAGGRLAEAVSELADSPVGVSLVRELSALVDWTADVAASPSSWELVPPSVPMTSKVVRFSDRFMPKGLDQLSAYDASEGTLHVLFGLTIVLHPASPRFFAIENFGNTLHPRLARSLIARLGELAIAHGRQIIVTTHNPLVLDGLPLADDRFRLLALDRTEQGQTKIARITHAEALQRANESGLTVSRMWAEGLLRAASPRRAAGRD